MTTKYKAKKSAYSVYYCFIGINLILLAALSWIKIYPTFIEDWYSLHFYPIWSYVYVFLFSWLPFSAGDILYASIGLLIIWGVISLVKAIVRRDKIVSKIVLLRILSFSLCLYNLFYINWGLNYYRIPLVNRLSLNTDQLSEADYDKVLNLYIERANELRDSLDFAGKHKKGVRGDLVEYVREDTLFDQFLSKTQIHAKEPLSSELMSYFTVSGYFNPFTMEVHVNQAIPLASYPFVTVHELAHQMGIGFEDECNFIAFVKLYEHKNIWYRYSAYYSALEHLIRPYSRDKKRMEQIKTQLSPKVLADFKEEREFWISFRGPIDELSAWFYNLFLQHNNQPEGLARYSMMAKLIVAWELKECNNK